MYKIGAISRMHVFKWFKVSEQGMRTLMISQGVGSNQLLEIHKQFQKINVGQRPSNDPYIRNINWATVYQVLDNGLGKRQTCVNFTLQSHADDLILPWQGSASSLSWWWVTEMVFEKSVHSPLNHLMWLIARESFTEFNCHENFRLCNFNDCFLQLLQRYVSFTISLIPELYCLTSKEIHAIAHPVIN